MRTNNFTEILRWAKEHDGKCFYAKGKADKYYLSYDLFLYDGLSLFGEDGSITYEADKNVLISLALVGNYSTEPFREFTLEEIFKAKGFHCIDLMFEGRGNVSTMKRSKTLEELVQKINADEDALKALGLI